MALDFGEINGLAASDFGQPVTINGLPCTGLFTEAGKQVQLYDGSIITTGPLLILSESDAELVTENETVIAIGATDYAATRKLPDGAGFVELELTRDI